MNVNLRGLNREVPEIAFFTLANHRGFGLSLEDQPIPPAIRPLEGPVWGFEVDDRGLAGVIAALDHRKVAYEGPVEYPSPVRFPRPSSYEISMISTTSFRCGVTGKRALSPVRETWGFVASTMSDSRSRIYRLPSVGTWIRWV